MFNFKQFSIGNNPPAMKVGTDAVLLGAWVPLENETAILDIGTGSGLLALMMAQRTENCPVDAVEINPAAAFEAENNVKSSPWFSRIKVFNTSFQQFVATSKNRYSLIISNPPFFSNSLKPKDSARNMARHNDLLPVAELLAGTSNLLANGGKAAFIIPFGELANWISLAESHFLYPSQIVGVKSSPSHRPHRGLILFKHSVTAAVLETELCIYSPHPVYSSEYKELTKDFYLDF